MRRLSSPPSAASTALAIFSVSTSIISWPGLIVCPSWTCQAASVPSFMERPHFGMMSGVMVWLIVPSHRPALRARRACAPPPRSLPRSEHRDPRATARTAPACAARSTIRIAAFSAPKASCATCAETSAAIEQRGLASSTQISRPVFSTLSITVSMSIGDKVLRSMTSHSTPSLASRLAASRERWTIRP